MIALLYAAGFVLNLLYGICGSIGMILAGLGGFAAFLALLDGSYAQAAASALVALLLCLFAAPMLLSLAGSALIVTAAADQGLVDIHDRRPLVLSPEAAREWMRQEISGKEASEIAASGCVPANQFSWHPVSRAVGNVKNQGAELIQPV